MMPDKIVTEELHRQAVWMIPFCLILIGILILLGHSPFRVLYSTAAGYAYTLFHFYSIGKSSVHAAAQSDPARATSIMVSGFMRRYLLTAFYLVFVFLSGKMDLLAGIIPLLFPKMILFIFYTAQKKGGS